MIDYNVGDVVIVIDDGPCQCGCGDAMPFKIGDVDRVTSFCTDEIDGLLRVDSPKFGLPTPSHWQRGSSPHRFRKLPLADPEFIKLIREIKPAKELEKV